MWDFLSPAFVSRCSLLRRSPYPGVHTLLWTRVPLHPQHPHFNNWGAHPRHTLYGSPTVSLHLHQTARLPTQLDNNFLSRHRRLSSKFTIFVFSIRTHVLPSAVSLDFSSNFRFTKHLLNIIDWNLSATFSRQTVITWVSSLDYVAPFLKIWYNYFFVPQL